MAMTSEGVAKHALRRAMRVVLRRRRAGGDETAAAAVAAALLARPAYRTARSLCVFLSSPAEVDTMPIVRDALGRGKRVFVPRVLDAAAGRMDLVHVRDLDDVLACGPNAWRIPEPASTVGRADALDAAECGRIDVVLTPGLAFDGRGARLGYGGGFYDRWLARLLAARRALGLDMPRLIGLCFAEQLVDRVPDDGGVWDFRVDETIAGSADGSADGSE